MRAVVQRVSHCAVLIDGKDKQEIGKGLLVFLGIEEADNQDDIEWLAGKISRLRIFPDEKGIMNLSVREIKGEIIIVSQFTLHASTKKGNRPSYIKAAKHETAIPHYEKFIKVMGHEMGKIPKTGRFGADMQVSLNNDGPVTIFIDTKNRE